ncbi:FUSC family protein [Streptomyces sp. 2P-4]|uniref:FUSC family protein n=1 Tax=Streptomyces sp. 2P-4 TaxID=2931974 RepID=UPI0025414FC6|nr:FUSC family protein [Streptomyces sp. 2P-4]
MGPAGVPRKRIAARYAAAARRSGRVTLAAGAAFYLFLYGFGETTAATYALFAAVSMAGLSRIPGTGRQRAAVLARLVPVCWLLVAVGTYLAVRTWTAVAGMLVIGFALAFVAAGGPRAAGAAPGLQLLYILPSFPPYDPGSLDERLIGTTAGLLLLILAEAYLFPDPPTVPYRELAARAADTAQACVRELAAPPWRLSAQCAADAAAAISSLRPMNVAEADRPAGPGVHERALSQTGLSARTLLARLVRLPAPPGGAGPAEPGRKILEAVRRTAAESAECLRGATPATGAREGLARARAGLVASHPEPAAAGARAGAPEIPAPPEPVAVLRWYAGLIEAADAALAMSTAAAISVRGRAAAPDPPPMRFWYARMRAPRLWWMRLEGHAGRRSVFFQNAVRISLALAAARMVAGLDTLPHGFWATLAALTLTRTTVRETGTTVRLALTGTLAGALLAAVLLAAVGTDTTVYAIALAPVMLLTFTLGPVKGVGWAQAMFTVTIALVFAQLAPATWQLAELRLLDVLIGSVIGAVFGLLAWPRGAHEELQRSAAVLMRGAAEIVVATTAAVAGGGVREVQPAVPGHRSLRHSLILAESAFAQYQSEPEGSYGRRGHAGQPGGAGRSGPAPEPDWQATVMAGHHTLWGADRLMEPPQPGPAPVTVPPLGPDAAEAVTRLGDRVAGRMLLVSAALDPGGDTPAAPVALRDPAFDGFAARPEGAPRLYYMTVFWLDSLITDLEHIAGTARN